MKVLERAKTSGAVLMIAACALGACSSVRGAAPTREQNTARLAEIAGRLAERWRTPVLVDPALVLSTPPTEPAAELPLDQALTRLCAPLPDVSWRRVHLPRERDGAEWSAGRLGAAARAVERMELRNLALFPSGGRPGAWFQKDRPAADREARIREGGFAAEPVCLVYGAAADSDGRAPESELAELQRRQLELQACEGNEAVAYGQMIQLLQQLPPEQMQAFAARTVEAGNRLWDAVPAGQRQEMIDSSMGVLKRAMERPAAPGPDSRAGRPAPRNHLLELRSIAAELGRRYDATFVVDPSLVLLSPPALPARGMPADEALAALTRGRKGLAWRRAHLPEAERRLLTKERLIQQLVLSIRALDGLEGSVLLDDASSGRFAAYARLRPEAKPGADELARAGLSERPVYVLYAPFAPPAGGTLEAQFVGLQRRQMALLLQMSPDQLARSMQGMIQAYQSADAPGRAGILGLPAMAGMMAGWMPRYAKERQP